MRLIKLHKTDDAAGFKDVWLNPSQIVALHPCSKGTIVSSTKGVNTVRETPEDISVLCARVEELPCG